LNDGNEFCLDPSCFVTLQRLDDTLKVLEEIENVDPFSTVYIPTNIYDVIIREPEQKFRELPSVLEGWLMLNPEKDVRGMSEEQKQNYKNIMQRILGKFQPVPAKTVADDIEKLGTESIHREDVIDLFGRIKGKIVFEIAAVSSRVKAKIIAFGRKTASLLSKLKVTVIEAPSKLKHQIKKRKGIATSLMIMLFAMSLPEVQEFINVYQLDPFPFTLASTTVLGAFGVLMIGNGK